MGKKRVIFEQVNDNGTSLSERVVFIKGEGIRCVWRQKWSSAKQFDWNWETGLEQVASYIEYSNYRVKDGKENLDYWKEECRKRGLLRE